MCEDTSQYNPMENILQLVHSNFVALPQNEMKRNNVILHNIVDRIINEMRVCDPLFDEIFRKLFYGGSYFEGLKVGHPDEYDIHILLELPPRVNAQVQVSNVHGYIHVKFRRNYANVLTNNCNRRHNTYLRPSFRSWNGCLPYNQRVKNWENGPRLRSANFGWGFRKFIDANNFMDATQVSKWVEKVLQKAFNLFPQTRSGKFVLPTEKGNFFVSIKTSGPAFTLHIERRNIHMDVDLVPCFIFHKDNWPGNPFIRNPVPWRSQFYVVPKKPKEVQGKATHYWVLNFQKQERELIKRRDNFKPAIKLIKKMRDMLGHDVVVSYFIKNVALWVLEDIQDIPSISLSYMFMKILKKYRDFLEDEEIPYYWNKYFNMVKHVDSETLNTIYKKVNWIINEVERNLDNKPTVIAKYLINREEWYYLKDNYNL